MIALALLLATLPATWYAPPQPVIEGATITAMPVGTVIRFGVIPPAGNSCAGWTLPITTTATSPTLPAVISWNTNPLLHAFPDPCSGVVKSIQFAQGATAYPVTYTLATGGPITITVPALVPPKTVVMTKTCTGPVVFTYYSDKSFSLDSSAVSCQ